MAITPTKISIYADDKASPVLRGIAAEAEKLNKKIASFDDAAKKFMSYGAGFLGVDTLKNANVEAFNAAARYQTLGVVVQQVGKISGQSIIDIDKNVAALRTMGIAGQEARQTLTQLMQSQVDIKAAPGLARIAQDAAVIGGMNSSEAFKSLVYGIQSAQVDVLRTIGINVNFEQSYAKVAAQLGKSTEALTEQEKVQARVNAVMEAGKNIAGTYESAMDTVGKKLSSLSRIQQDLTTDFGHFALEVVSSTRAVEDVSAFFESLSAKILVLRGLMIGVSWSEMVGAVGSGGLQGLRSLVEGFESAGDEAKRFETRLSSVSGKLTAADTEWFQRQLVDLKKQFDNGTLSVDAYRRSINELQVLLKAQLNMPAFDAPRPDILNVQKSVDDLRAYYNKTGQGEKDNKLKELKKQQQELATFRNEFSKEEYSRMNGALSKEYESLTKVEGAEKVENATRKWAEFTRQIATMNSEASKSDESLQKSLEDIARTGKEAGKSASEIEAMRTAFSNAFEVKTLRDLNKELAQAEGNTRAVMQLENTSKIAEFENKLSLIKGMTPEEKEIFLGRFKAGLERASNVKDVQTVVNFLNDINKLSGNYNLGVEYQNELLRQQADIIRTQLPPALQPYVDQWIELKRLETARDPLSGSIVSLRQYASEATNLAKGVGQVWTNAFSSIEGALVNTLNNQSVSLKNFFNQLLMDIERVAIRASITGPLASGLGSFFSSFSWGGAQTTNPSSSWADFGVKPGASMPVSGFHRGGTVGADTPTFMRNVPMSLFYDAPRYHGGSSTLGYALSADEEAAILLKGEKVLNRQQTQAFNAGMSMSGVLGQLGAVGGTNWQQPQLNVYVQSSGDTTAKASAQPNNTGGFDLNIALVKMVDQGLASMGAQNSSELVKFMDKTRGLDKSRSLYGKG